MTKANKKFVEQLKEVKKGLNRRMGLKMCEELDGDCFDCQTRILIAYINKWINLLKD